ncbi:MAG: hypothetical protein OEV50_05475, partial [Candidatus Aminicenantes bacterium]|nr:hypothetical protein [Candidatus Aminicenantes bacterium]
MTKRSFIYIAVFLLSIVLLGGCSIFHKTPRQPHPPPPSTPAGNPLNEAVPTEVQEQAGTEGTALTNGTSVQEEVSNQE